MRSISRLGTRSSASVLSARLGLAEAKVKVKSYRGISMPVPRVPFFRQANLPVVETDTAGEGVRRRCPHEAVWFSRGLCRVLPESRG